MTHAIISHALVRASAMTALVLCSAAPVAAATLTAFASMHDAFGTAPDVIDAPPPRTFTSLITGSETPSVSATARDPETGGGGTALAKGAEFNRGHPDGHVEVGVAAAARSQGNRVGSAQASALIDFEIRVEITLPQSNDPILATLFTICGRGHNCNLSVDFLHQTTGSFIYSTFLTRDAGAQFSESVVINDKSIAGVASINGTQSVGGEAVSVGVSGAWRLDDFLPGVGTPGETVLNFNHFAHIDEVHGDFSPDTRGTDDIIAATYTAEIAQQALAGFGSSDYAFGVVAADFAHTSRLRVAGIHEPVTGLDLSGLDIRVSYRDLSAVPLPAPLGMLAPVLLGLARHTRRRPTVHKR